MIRTGDRVLAVGHTGSGKSRALGVLFARYPGQRLLIDVGDAYQLGERAFDDANGGAWEGDDVDAIDWTRRTLRFVPRRLNDREYDDVYRQVFARGRMFVWLDEAFGPTTQHSAPLFLRRTVTQGRKRGITHAAASQRPAGIARELVNQAEHAFIFRTVDRDDVDALAYRCNLQGRELTEAIAGLEAPDDPNATWTGFLRHMVGRQDVVAYPPIPPAWIDEADAVVRF